MTTHDEVKTSAWLLWRPHSPQTNEDLKRYGMIPRAGTDPEFLGLYPSMEAAEAEIEVLRETTGAEWYATSLMMIGWGVTQWQSND